MNFLNVFTPELILMWREVQTEETILIYCNIITTTP